MIETNLRKTKIGRKKNMGTTEKKQNKERVTFSHVMQHVCTFYVFLYVLLMAVWFPFFLTWGYRSAGTDKAMLFRFLGLGLLLSVTPCALLYWICKWKAAGTKAFVKKIPDSDWLVIAYFVVTIVSFLCSENKAEAFWGAKGWYIGFVTQMIYLLSYFFISRFLKGEKALILCFAISTSVSFGLGILNRFSVYPLTLEGANPSFIATLGNINWFCGYWSIFFSMAVGLFYCGIIKQGGCENHAKMPIWKRVILRMLSGIYLALATAAGAVQGSDSAMLVFVAVTIVLFCVSCRDFAHRKAFYVTLLVMCGACQVVRVVRVIFPDTINYDCRTTELLTGGNLTLIIFAVALVLWMLFYQLQQREESGKIKEKRQEQRSDKWRGKEVGNILRRERTVVLALLTACAAIFLFLLIRNNLQPGSIGSLSGNPAFTFNAKWGSSRGATWTAGLQVFDDMSFGKKLIGLGPDCFAYGVYRDGSSAKQLVVDVFGSSRLTNAHNEWITVLVNTGILGLLSFVGFFFAKTIRYIRAFVQDSGNALGISVGSDWKSLALVFASGLALVGYTSHNLFSFQQALNGPFVYIMMGIGEALLLKKKKEEKNS